MNFKHNVIFTRKPRVLDDVTSEAVLSTEEFDFIPKFKYEDVLGKSLLADFKIQAPTLLILIKDNEKYLVNTSGYNYPRYISKIVKIV